MKVCVSKREAEREIQKLQKKYGTRRRLSLASDMDPEPHWPIRAGVKEEKSKTNGPHCRYEKEAKSFLKKTFLFVAL